MNGLGLCEFAYRQFDDPEYSGTYIDWDKEMFLAKVNEIIGKNQGELCPGYAPFCKHMFIENFTRATPGSLPITPENEALMQSGFVARRPEELPVLCRWFPRSQVGHMLKPASYLDLILYSKEQVTKERNAMNGTDNLPTDDQPDYYIIAIKAQDTQTELPMSPITVMRNAIISEGGSGVPIERKKYMEAVHYWQQHCEVRGD
eukprot:GHVO01027157.1.p1 GENE.GHVO01027157.1~~GHVO01027157.1.p1  ORF type:complete len:203 (+),score=33.03 GHVO01027157.1:54-662(+)